MVSSDLGVISGLGSENCFTLPDDFLDRMKRLLGEEYEAFLACYRNGPHRALRVNPLKSNKAEIIDRFSQKNERLSRDFHLTPVEWEETGFYFGEEDAPGRSPYHDAGVYYIQEPSAMYPVSRLRIDDSGLKVLDLCAAPGGKSTQIAAKMNGRGILFSNEIHPVRVRALSENMERMGVRNALVLNETPERLAERFPCFFDRILVDAPCSGEGMFQKNETAIPEWSLKNVELCAARQADILEKASRMLNFGGRMVYTTCTFSPEENEGVIESFLNRHSEYELIDLKRLYPHKIRGEGHFAAVLQKKEGLISASAKPLTGLQKTLRPKDFPELLTFLKKEVREPEEVLGLSGSGVLIRFGEKLYAAPRETPELSGLKVSRPGLLLGESKTKRFEPSHALGMALKPGEVFHAVNFSLYDNAADDRDRITDWLKGLTFEHSGESGYYLICADGYSLGFGKLANNIMKNRYPKGLRKY